jgi:hypothetical protein
VNAVCNVVYPLPLDKGDRVLPPRGAGAAGPSTRPPAHPGRGMACGARVIVTGRAWRELTGCGRAWQPPPRRSSGQPAPRDLRVGCRPDSLDLRDTELLELTAPHGPRSHLRTCGPRVRARPRPVGRPGRPGAAREGPPASAAAPRSPRASPAPGHRRARRCSHVGTSRRRSPVLMGDHCCIALLPGRSSSMDPDARQAPPQRFPGPQLSLNLRQHGRPRGRAAPASLFSRENKRLPRTRPSAPRRPTGAPRTRSRSACPCPSRSAGTSARLARRRTHPCSHVRTGDPHPGLFSAEDKPLPVGRPARPGPAPARTPAPAAARRPPRAPPPSGIRCSPVLT